MRTNQALQFKRLAIQEIERAIAEDCEAFTTGYDYGSYEAMRYAQGKIVAYGEAITLLEVAYDKLFKDEEEEDNND